jgi:hypothetical protein
MRILLGSIALLLFLSINSYALDQGHIPEMSNDEFEKYILTAFQKVEVYYPATNTDGSIITEIDTLPLVKPKLISDIKYGLILFFDPNECEEFLATIKDLEGGKIKSSYAGNLLKEMYKRRNESVSIDRDKPDFIILADLQKKLPVYEYLVDEKSKEIFTFEYEDKKIIPAFLSQQKAIAFQQKAKSQGLNLARIGLDEKSFMEFILDQGRKGSLTLIEGFKSM